MKRILILVLSLVSSGGWAVQKVDLYTATQLLPISAKQEQINDAISLGLSDVITRITGSREYGESNYVSSLRRNAANLLDSYGFEASNQTLTDRLGDAVPAQLIKLKFNTDKVLSIIRQQQWPVWSESRPELLLWGVLANNQGNQLVTLESLPEFTNALEKSATARGLPILWPWADLQDMQQMVPQRMWLNDFGNQSWLKERYQADVQARFVLSKSAEMWVFEYSIDAFKTMNRIESDSLAMIAETWVDQMAETFAANLRIDRTAVNQTLLFQISGVDSLAKHKKIENYLSKLTVVTNMQLFSQKGQTLIFKLITPASISQFKDILAVERFFAPDPALEMFNDELNYQFIGN